MVLVGLIVWSEGDQITFLRHDSSKTLFNFKIYRNRHMGIKTHDKQTGRGGSEDGGPLPYGNRYSTDSQVKIYIKSDSTNLINLNFSRGL